MTVTNVSRLLLAILSFSRQHNKLHHKLGLLVRKCVYSSMCVCVYSLIKQNERNKNNKIIKLV